MTPRDPQRPLHRLLLGQYAAHRRARILRASIRAAGWAAVAIALVLAAGVVRTGGEPWAWARLVLVSVALVVSIARAVAGVRAASSGFDGFLERLEQHFPDLRSW